MSTPTATNDPHVIKSLAKGGLEPKDIDYIVLSHVHMDHTGDPRLFPDSTFVLGPGTQHHLKTSDSWMHYFPDIPNKTELAATDNSATQGVKATPPGELSFTRPWTSLPHLPSVLDIFGDNTVLIVDAPGHLPGHLNMLMNTSDGRRMYLGGDSSHDIRVVTGEREFATGLEHIWGPQGCPHVDLETAKKTVERIRRLREEGVEIVLAHDAGWEGENRGRFWGREGVSRFAGLRECN